MLIYGLFIHLFTHISVILDPHKQTMWPIYLSAILSTVVSLPIVFPCVEISTSKYACTTPQWSISGDIVFEIIASGNVEHSVHASSFASVP